MVTDRVAGSVASESNFSTSPLQLRCSGAAPAVVDAVARRIRATIRILMFAYIGHARREQRQDYSRAIVAAKVRRDAQDWPTLSLSKLLARVSAVAREGKCRLSYVVVKATRTNIATN